MSHEINDRLADEIRDLEEIVQFHKDYWVGTLWERVLENALEEAKKTLDPTKINQLLLDSSREMFVQEYQPAIAEWKEKHPNTGFNLDGVPF